MRQSSHKQGMQCIKSCKNPKQNKPTINSTVAYTPSHKSISSVSQSTNSSFSNDAPSTQSHTQANAHMAHFSSTGKFIKSHTVFSNHKTVIRQNFIMVFYN